MADVGSILSERLMAAAQVVEEQLDAEMNKLEKLDEDDLEAIRRQRLANLEKAQAKKREWLKQGHGEYQEISEEKEFFNVTKNPRTLFVSFIEKKHLGAKFLTNISTSLQRSILKLNFAKSMQIRAKTKDYIIGFTELGNKDEFSTAMLEWRLARSDIINYSGDLMTPPDQVERSKTSIIKKQHKTIRGNNCSNSSDEDDW
ncbi:Thioredoxin domain-containing protein 9 [Lepeophtheirus salmonis]|uniref:Thioredoxin domain-containing protein 9 n=1 Tax=Lepeophtheirus salmonis TaxID=72036 RepID=A0A7R8D5D1_LEPSM|nr:Thioredoxin domain-containing protein 9 [Lepeophtheirus salmonis]CAF3034685.1 Thioredoxin domain-containing protein 9 [Lepeophtheirus salmonis]